MVSRHAPHFRCRRKRPPTSPPWTGPSLVDSPEFKAFVQQRREERERREREAKEKPK